MSDVSDDVQRAAVIAVGFVMCNVPDQLPGVVKLLSESAGSAQRKQLVLTPSNPRSGSRMVAVGRLAAQRIVSTLVPLRAVH